MEGISHADERKNAPAVRLEIMLHRAADNGSSSSVGAANGVSFVLNHKQETQTLLSLEID